MDIHKPKPWHGLREFAKEIGTIVAGVLIALGAEQAVERVHRQHEMVDARDVIRHEVADNLAELDIRTPSRACVVRRLSQIEALLDAADRGHPLAAATWIGRPNVPPLTTSRWEAATASGRTSLFSNDEQATYANLYARFDLLKELYTGEQETWAELRALQGRERLTPEMIDRYKVAVHKARYAFWRQSLSLERLTEATDAIHISPTPRFVQLGRQVRIVSACLPMDTPSEKAIALVDAPFGEPD